MSYHTAELYFGIAKLETHWEKHVAIRGHVLTHLKHSPANSYQIRTELSLREFLRPPHMSSAGS
jgi:hypothetical protein